MNDKQIVETNQTLPSLSLCKVLRSLDHAKSCISDFGNWRIGLFKNFVDTKRERPRIYFVVLSLKNNEAACVRLWPTFHSMNTVEVCYNPDNGNSRTIGFEADYMFPRVYPGTGITGPDKYFYEEMIGTLKQNQPNFKLINGEYGNRKSYTEYCRRLFIHDDTALLGEIEWSISIREANHSISLKYEMAKKVVWYDRTKAYIQLDFKNDGIMGKYSHAVYRNRMLGIIKKDKIMEFDEQLDKLFKIDGRQG